MSGEIGFTESSFETLGECIFEMTPDEIRQYADQVEQNNELDAPWYRNRGMCETCHQPLPRVQP